MNWKLHLLAGVLGGFILYRIWPYLNFFLSAAGAVFKMSRTKNPPCELPPDVIHVRDRHVSAWFVKGDQGWIAFDAGQHPSLVRDSLGRDGVEPGQVSHVFLTHTDSDHVGGLKLFLEAEVMIARAEEQLISGAAKRTFSRSGVSFGGNRLRVPHITLGDGQAVKVQGRTVECILTPGHTPGSMCFLVDGSYLFTGDSLALENGRITEFTPIFTMDPDGSRRSIAALVERLRGRPVEYLFTGHSGFTDDYSRASERW